MAADLPTAAAVTSDTTTNAQQKVYFAAWLNATLGWLGAKFGIGPQTIASAATLDLEAVTDTRDLVISGTTAITAVTVEAGKVFRCRASGAFTLTNNAAIVTQRGANIVCRVGDTFMLRATAANTVEVLFFTAAAVPYVKDNIIGTVSQSGGVPTGAIIESGSNSDGNYIRYADGTQICYVTKAGNYPVTTASGGIVVSTADETWTFPLAFVAAPSVSGIVSSGVPQAWIVLGNSGVATTVAYVRAGRGASSGAAIPFFNLTAVGRWF